MFCHINYYFILSAVHIVVRSCWNECPFTLVHFGTPLHPLNSAQVSLLWENLTVPPLVRINHFLSHPCPCDCIFRSVRAGDTSHLPSPQYSSGIMLAGSNLESRNKVFILLSKIEHRTGVKNMFWNSADLTLNLSPVTY